MAFSLIIPCYMSRNPHILNPCSRSQTTPIFNPLSQAKNIRTSCQRSVLLLSNKRPRDLVVHATPETGDLLSGVIPFLPSGENSWMSWAVGLGVTLPLLTARLLTVTKQVAVAAETVESVADAVGKVADEVDKVAEEFAEKLPEGGMLKGIVKSIEHLAEETEKDAQLVEDLMDKVEEVDQKLEAFISNQVKQTVKVPNSNDGMKTQ